MQNCGSTTSSHGRNEVTYSLYEALMPVEISLRGLLKLLKYFSLFIGGMSLERNIIIPLFPIEACFMGLVYSPRNSINLQPLMLMLSKWSSTRLNAKVAWS